MRFAAGGRSGTAYYSSDSPRQSAQIATDRKPIRARATPPTPL